MWQNHILQYDGTGFNSLATYFCQPGFKEPKYKRSSVTLRCGESDDWIGLDFDKNTKAVCEPLSVEPLPWLVCTSSDDTLKI